MPINMGQPSGSIDSSAHQVGHSANTLFPGGLPHTSMPNDPLTAALGLLPPELLQSHQHQHLHQQFAQLPSSQPVGSASLLSHVHSQMQTSHDSLLPQAPHVAHGSSASGLSQPPQVDMRQAPQLSNNQPGSSQQGQPHQQSRSRHQQRSPATAQHQQQQSQQPQPSQHQQSSRQSQPLPNHQGQQGQSLRPQGHVHLNHGQHQSSPQPQQPPNLAQLLGSASTAQTHQPALLQQHASVLADVRSSMSTFSASLHDAKQKTPADRADIRNVVSILDGAVKTLAAEIEQGVVKLRALQGSAALNSFAGLLSGSNANSIGPGSTNGNDLFGALNQFGLQQNQQQQQQHGNQGLPFDLGLGFHQQSQSNGMFNINGTPNSNGPNGGPSGLNAPFHNDVTIGQGGSGSQNASMMSSLLAQYLSQSNDPAGRLGALSLFQSLAGAGGAGSLPAGMQGLDALLNQALPQQTQAQQQTQQQARPGQQGAHLPNGAPLTNAAALAALTSLGVTPTMLEALGLGSVAQQMLEAPDDGPSTNSSKQRSRSPDMREDSPEAASVEGSSEPSRKKRKHVRGKVQIQPDVGVSRPPSKIVESKATSESRPGPASATPTSPPIASAANRDRNVASSSTIPGSAGPSDASKRIPTLGVGLRQEGDKRYRNRKLLRDLREHLYRWLGTDEFRKLRNTYKVAEWVPNPHLTDEEKQILASLPPAAVAQPPITTHIFHVDFTSRDFYRTNQSLIDAIVAEGSKKVEAKPEAYAIVPGTIDRDHLEDVAKDLMDSARSGFRMSLRTGLQAEKEDKEKHEKYRGVERAKTKCRNREIGAGRLRHAIPKQLLIPGAYSDDAASDEDLHGLTKSEWKRQRLRKLRIAKGWEAVTPKWRNKHLTRAYHKADIVSKSKQMARWRRDDPVDLPIPIKLYGKLLPKQLFDPDWLAEHRKELEEEPYCIRINDNDIDGWEESHHPLGEDTSDEMEWSDAKESSLRGRQLTSAPSSSRDRGSNTQSPAPIAGSSSVPITRPGEDSKAGSSTPVLQASSSALAASEAAQPEADKAPESKTLAQTASEAEATSSISGSSRSGNVDTADTGDTGASESESDVSTTDKPPAAPAQTDAMSMSDS
ncbi:hypothetical protein PaG_03926 [Moesziomyces aphidis]|uniref:Uncharacterized protein n=1 Tax=Moesziomyces aphidis TaxID=84754 RepID=W3VJK0_MOEAP|nr:hypothetical protein PaG_03926 [Moesziomyces aphidis]